MPLVIDGDGKVSIEELHGVYSFSSSKPVGIPQKELPSKANFGLLLLSEWMSGRWLPVAEFFGDTLHLDSGAWSTQQIATKERERETRLCIEFFE